MLLNAARPPGSHGTLAKPIPGTSTLQPTAQGVPGAAMRPPFIVSNALAAASGLSAPARRTFGTALPPRPPLAPQVRLPSHKDLLDDDRELAAIRAQNRTNFERRLADDHARCLAPDTSAFSNTAEVVARLLPYHIWNVPDDDVLHAAEARIESEHVWQSRAREDRECSYALPYKCRRTDTPAVLSLPPFPTSEYTTDLYQRHARILGDIASLCRRADGVNAGAPQSALSIEQLERLAYEEESRAYQMELSELRRLRTELEEIDRRVAWGTRVPPAAASAAMAAAATTRMSPLSPAVVSHLAGLTARVPGTAPNPQPAPAQLPQAAPMQPLPLVVPISAVSRMSALGLNIVPAPHLVPALSLASAGQSVPINPGLTAPRPLTAPQTEPVLLVGITEGPVPGASGTTRQHLHLSVILSMLRSDQLSGLATLMQTLQAEDNARARESS